MTIFLSCLLFYLLIGLCFLIGQVIEGNFKKFAPLQKILLGLSLIVIWPWYVLFK